MGCGWKCRKQEIKGKMWQVVRPMYINSKGCVFFLEGRSSDFFTSNEVLLRVACYLLQCTLSWIHQWSIARDENCPLLGVKFCNHIVSNLITANDFVRLAETRQTLQCSA